VLVASFAIRAWASHQLECRLIARIRDEHERSCQLQARLLEAQKSEAVGTLAGGVAHDFDHLLRNALATVGSLSRKLDRGVAVGDDVEEIERGLWRAMELTSRLVRVSSKQEVRALTIDPRETAAHVAALLPRVLPGNIRLDVVAPAKTPPIEVDPASFEQALLNLCLNARDSMSDRGGTLTVAVSTATGLEGIPGDAVTIAVHDTGDGIAPELLPRVFEPFFTTKPHGAGRGLGLATVEVFVGAHGGTLCVDSAPGRGSTFRMAFRAQVAAQPVSERLPCLAGTAIVVDGGDASGLAAAGILERCGLDVVSVSTPEQAIDAARGRADDVDVVIADAASGLAARRSVRALRDVGVNAPFILITGTGADPSGEWPRVVRKPVDARDLVAVVREALAR